MVTAEVQGRGRIAWEEGGRGGGSEGVRRRGLCDKQIFGTGASHQPLLLVTILEPVLLNTVNSMTTTLVPPPLPAGSII